MIHTYHACPLGTYIDPSSKGVEGCQTCPAGNPKSIDLLMYYPVISINAVGSKLNR